jgi:hypothetical protein
MRRVFTVLTAALAVVAFGSMVFAQAATEKKAEKTAVKAEKTVKTAALAASGKVAKFDEATKTLTVTTKTGEMEFTLGADAKIMEGAKTATTADLAGKTVKVTYTTVEGKHVASKVTIAAAKAAAPAKVEKKEEKKEEKK